MALESGRPTYIRIGKKGEADLCGTEAVPAIGQSLSVHQGSQVCILAVGTVAHEAVEASDILKEQGVSAEVVLNHTVKPAPLDVFRILLEQFECIVTVEEHAKAGGFGESFLSYLASSGHQKRVVTLGTGDEFMPMVGSQEFARRHFDIDSASIVRAALALLANNG
jgi:transketolase